MFFWTNFYLIFPLYTTGLLIFSRFLNFLILNRLLEPGPHFGWRSQVVGDRTLFGILVILQM